MILFLKKFTLIPFALSDPKDRIEGFSFWYPSIHFLRTKNTQDEREKNKYKATPILNCFALFLLFLYSTISAQTPPKLMTFHATDDANNAKEVTITFVVPEKDFIYKDFISCSIYEPEVLLSTWKTNQPCINHYDATFKETKQVFNETFSINLTATQKKYHPHPIHLYCSYYRASEKKMGHAIFSFTFTQPLNTNIQINDANIEPIQYKHHNTSISPHTPHTSPINVYYTALINTMQRITSFFVTHHRKCFFGLILLMGLLFLLLYFYQERLRKYAKLYEIVEITTTLCVVMSTAYALKYFYAIGTSSVQLFIITISIILSAITGYFYIKKSTQLSSGSLRTFCTCIGMLCIIGVLFLAFKTLQYVDEKFQLFPHIQHSIFETINQETTQ